ncbi:hypothetical protein [Paenibacillus mendelii]|uniref:YrzO family protein n=1 Tax=Paenibacillus mendelii TaxID=206163 RepID=A0ABV6JEV0_9BACL|nr:hypothetical protein [Paenibacillus mendelii]MCQ6557302.1 hypothetical protein [Paenibacillus mendelii]
METMIFVALVILGIISIDIRLKKHVEHDAKIIERLDVLIQLIKDKEKKE